MPSTKTTTVAPKAPVAGAIRPIAGTMTPNPSADPKAARSAQGDGVFPTTGLGSATRMTPSSTAAAARIWLPRSTSPRSATDTTPATSGHAETMGTATVSPSFVKAKKSPT